MKSVYAVLLLIALGQPMFALFVFPAMTTSRDSDIFHQIRDDDVRKMVYSYHQKNQRLARNSLFFFSISALVIASVASLQAKKK